MGKDLSKVTATFYFCDGSSCQKAGGEESVRSARAYLRNNRLMEAVHTIKTRCNGRCEDAPTMIVHEGNYWYKKVNKNKVVEIVKSHIDKKKPIDDYLLFQPTYDMVDSQNEKPPFKIKPFEKKYDHELGDCLITRGLSSDQYLHPLFMHLVDNPGESKLILSDGREIGFADFIEVRYSKKFELELVAANDITEFVIAAIPKDREDLIPSKISVTEYFYQEKKKMTGLRFKNKKGETLALIELGNKESDNWKYCTEIQLQNNEIKEVIV